MENKNCLICKDSFSRKPRFNKKWWENAKYCSQACSAKSRIGKPGGMLGKTAWNKGKSVSDTERERLSKMRKGLPAWNKGKIGQYNSIWSEAGKKSFSEKMGGVNNPRWISDRTKLVKTQNRNDSAYKEWRKSVRDRDGWLCKMASGDCFGKVVAHHILPWAKFPELRYEVNNGITLCKIHHPSKREEEIRLSPYFQSLLVNEH